MTEKFKKLNEDASNLDIDFQRFCDTVERIKVNRFDRYLHEMQLHPKTANSSPKKRESTLNSQGGTPFNRVFSK